MWSGTSTLDQDSHVVASLTLHAPTWSSDRAEQNSIVSLEIFETAVWYVFAEFLILSGGVRINNLKGD